MRNKDMSSKEKLRKIKAGTKKFAEKNKISDTNARLGIMSENEDIGNIGRIKSGNVAYDVLTGGLFDEKVNVIYGGPGAGKSTFIRDTSKATKDLYDAFTVYLDAEKSFDRKYWLKHGVDPDSVLLGEFETTEQGLDLCMQCATGTIPADLLVIDTLQALSPEGELKDGKGVKSVSKNTMALIPRLYSQFLRMHTSMNTGMTMLLVSQIRTTGIGSVPNPYSDMTGGNAIKHYTLNTVYMRRSDSKSEWPYTVEKLPANSFVAIYTIKKIKSVDRYAGLSIKAYFVNGRFDKRFNVIAIAKDLGIFDGKELTYPDPENKDKTLEYKSRGLNETINGSENRRLPEAAVNYLESQLEPTFTKLANSEYKIFKIEEEEESPSSE